MNTASSPNTPSRPVSIIGDATTASSTRTSLSVEDGARENNDEKPTGLPSPVTPSTKEVIQSESPSHPDGTKGSSSSRPSSASQNASSDPVVNLQRTVSLLIAERSDLQTQIASLQALLTSAKGDSQLLAEGRTLISQLEREKRDLEAGLNESNERANKAAETAIELRKAETQLESLRKEREDLVGQIGDVEKRRLEREEGERVRTRELERAREREGGLEAEVGRLRQVSGDALEL